MQLFSQASSENNGILIGFLEASKGIKSQTFKITNQISVTLFYMTRNIYLCWLILTSNDLDLLLPLQSTCQDLLCIYLCCSNGI